MKLFTGLAPIVLLLAGACAPEVPDLRTPAERIDQLITDLVEDGDFAGTVLVARRGQMLVRKAYGMADIERGVANTPETTFQLASVSKLFTRQLILQDVRDGTLNLEDPLSDFLPGFRDANRIRIRHLLNHTSGIADANNRDPRLSEPSLAAVVRDRAEMLEIFQEEGLLFAPGTNQHYSSPGYSLLAYILEDIHDAPFAELLQQRVFEPLEMSHSTFAEGDNVAIPYWNHDGRLQVAPPIDSGHYIGASGVHSNVDDLYRWYLAVYRDRSLGDVATGEFGMGSHYGRTWGSASGFYPIPQEDIVVIVLSNLGHAPVQSIVPRIVTLLLEPMVTPIETARVEELVGSYRMDFFDTMSHVAVVGHDGDRLVLTATLLPGGEAMELGLLPIDSDRFLVAVNGALMAGAVTFLRDADGEVVGLILENAGIAFQGSRIPSRDS